jgi:two-component system, OmpR family, response regulator
VLVLSRRLHEKILFPSLDIAVQVVGVNPGGVRLGIQAPPEVTVLREELHDRAPDWGTPELPPGDGKTQSKVSELRHFLRNRLNVAAIGLTLMRQQLEVDRSEEAQVTLTKLEEDFQLLRQRLAGNLEDAKLEPMPGPLPSRRALLVEDDHNERELLAGLLRIAGLDVVTVEDGIAALDCLQTPGRPDVVLLDMVLPRCDGPTIVREIRSNPAHAGLKIFAVTGYSPEELLLDGDLGVDRWFNKPLNPEAFLHDLNQELNGCLSRTAF